MSIPEILAQYESRIRDLQVGLQHARLHGNLAAVVLTVAVTLSLLLGLKAAQQQVSVLWPSTSIPFVVVAARRMHRHRKFGVRLSRLRRFYDRAIQRLLGNWAGQGATGMEFEDSSHLYSRDLNLFGEASLFQLLCTARSSIGRRGLAGYLLNSPSAEVTLLRQDAIRELAGQLDLRERLAVLGEFDFAESRWETFAEWLDAPSLYIDKRVRISAFFTSALLVGMGLVGLAGLASWVAVAICITPLLAFQLYVGLLFQRRVRKLIQWLLPVAHETRVLRDGLRLMEERQFQSVKLRELAARVRHSARAVRKLERMLDALRQRNKELFYYPSLVLLFATQMCWAIESWRVRHGAALRVWLEAWAEFEALNALANYAYENPGHTFPELLNPTKDATFEADALGHPLLSNACVRNDIRLNRESRFYLISGSNMSGKSTLLRAIGLNAVLAFAGAPVRARTLRLSQLSVGASLSVVDSLASGKSKFMAEVDRLRRILEAAAKEMPVLFLVDEIFAGTNSRDRRIAAEAVVRTLVGRGAIGALSTHDLALSEIADAPDLGGMNVHTGSRDGGDPMDFDYRLKPGPSHESNALAIARLAGVPV